MTITRIVTLLSVIALLASLPLTVALAQQPPFRVVGNATLDGESVAEGAMVVAMIGEEKVGSTMVGMDGMFQIDVDGETGSMVMFSVMMGEGDDMMEYMAMSEADVMIGDKGDVKRADLMAYSDPENMPAPAEPHQDRRRRNGGHAWPPGPYRKRRPPGRNGTPG